MQARHLNGSSPTWVGIVEQLNLEQVGNHCFLVLDALDEGYSGGMLLRDLQQLPIHILVTGRPFVEPSLSVLKWYRILEVRAPNKDIEVFVKGCIAKNLGKHTSELQNQIIQTVVSKSNGM
jgi:hypothetical protein